MSRNDDMINIEVTLVRDVEDDEAILVKDDDGRKVWLPRSLVEYTIADEHSYKRGIITVTLPEWLGIEKGLI